LSSLLRSKPDDQFKAGSEKKLSANLKQDWLDTSSNNFIVLGAKFF
jgi:hypothetical protein